MNLTLKLKLNISSRDAAIDDLMKRYTQALNYVSHDSVEKQIPRNLKILSKTYYKDVRERFGLFGTTAACATRDVTTEYSRLKKSRTKKELDKPITFKEGRLPFCYKYNFDILNFKDDITPTVKDDLNKQDDTTHKKTIELSIALKLDKKRTVFKIKLCPYYQEIMSRATKICNSHLLRKKDTYYFFLVVEVPEKERVHSGTAGVNLGLVKMATVADSKHKTLVVHGGFLRDRRKKFINLRKRLQAKDTKSAKRVLRRLSGKEKRYIKDTIFCKVRDIINFAEQNEIGYIGLENLKGVRKAKAGRALRTELNSWSYSQFREILEYKAKLAGIEVVVVPAQYTSQVCYKCGHTEKANRKTQKDFICKACGHKDNADINAAKNIETIARVNVLENISVQAEKP